MTYEETIRNLFDILYQCNAADGDKAAGWQYHSDANTWCGTYGYIRKAIESLAGEDVIKHWAETGELDHSLCDRSEEGILAINLGAAEERGEITLDGDYPTHSRVGGYAISYLHDEHGVFCGDCIVDEDCDASAGKEEATATILYDGEDCALCLCEYCGTDLGN